MQRAFDHGDLPASAIIILPMPPGGYSSEYTTIGVGLRGFLGVETGRYGLIRFHAGSCVIKELV